MSPKQLRRVALGLVVVVFLWGASAIVTRGGDEPEAEVLFPSHTAMDVDSIFISRPGESLVFVRTGADWTVNGHAASSDAMDQLFNALAAAPLAALVATNEALHARMGVDSASGKRLRFVRGDQQVGAFVFGNQGSVFSSAFVRREGENLVFEYAGTLSRLVSQSLDDWRDKVVVDVEADSIGTIVINRRRGGYTLARTNGGWRIGSSPADSAAVLRLVGQFNPLTATGFPTDAQLDSANFARPDLSITLLGLGGDTVAAMALDSTAAAYWLQRASDGVVFRLLQWKVNQIAPADSTLR